MSREGRRRGRFVRVALAVVAVPALALGALWLFQRSLVFLPDRGAPPPAATVVAGARDVVLPTADGLELGAYVVPADDDCGVTVLLASGNAGNRGHRAELIRALAAEGLGVLALDYRGYGGNPGAPSESGLALDVRAAREYLLTTGVAPERLVYVGESLGAAVVAGLAAEHPPAALVLRSPFTSLADAARAAYGVPVGWLLWGRFPVAEQVRAVEGPVAVIYGSSDGIIPARLSRAVADSARDAGAVVLEIEVAGAGHNDAELVHGPALVGAVVDLAPSPGCG